MQRRYPYDWLTMLAHLTAPVEGIRYAIHPDGFAGMMPRAGALGRLYLQVPADEDIARWSTARMRDELDRRLGTDFRPPGIVRIREGSSVTCTSSRTGLPLGERLHQRLRETEVREARALRRGRVRPQQHRRAIVAQRHHSGRRHQQQALADRVQDRVVVLVHPAQLRRGQPVRVPAQPARHQVPGHPAEQQRHRTHPGQHQQLPAQLRGEHPHRDAHRHRAAHPARVVEHRDHHPTDGPRVPS
ncbi:hypothetical protein [Saccharopolyspora gregorii]|uniref:Uncharacterized protein n=1 Tax=Saccharopolyspora gregorii TaxID=33914 RepID=A0ABP6RHQ4_9PSEU